MFGFYIRRLRLCYISSEIFLSDNVSTNNLLITRNTEETLFEAVLVIYNETSQIIIGMINPKILCLVLHQDPGFPTSFNCLWMIYIMVFLCGIYFKDTFTRCQN